MNKIMTWEQRGMFIMNQAFQLGFKQEDYIEKIPIDWMDKYSFQVKYLHVFEKMFDFAESYLCEHQLPEFTKEVYYYLTYKRSFGFYRSNGTWADMDNSTDLINWNKYPDCKDDDKIFFSSCLDSDNKTVLKFYDLGIKRHQS